MWIRVTASSLSLLLLCTGTGCVPGVGITENAEQKRAAEEAVSRQGSLDERTLNSAAMYTAAINHPGRSAEDMARDASSKPAEVLAFMDVRSGQAVLDFQAGAGYFSELLSYAVGEKGKVFVHNHSQEGVISPEVFEKRYGNNRLANTELIYARHNDLQLPAGSLDAVLMSMVYHDTYWFNGVVDWGPVDHGAFLHSLHDALKPGGVVLVIDHQAVPGADPYESAMTSHRIDRAIVLRDFLSAGFILQAESDLLRNSADAYEAQIFEEGVYRNTDRFMLLFAKARPPSD